MSEDQSADGANDTGAEEAAEGPDDPGPLRRAWQSLRAAGQWVADTFVGHSGAHQMRERER